MWRSAHLDGYAEVTEGPLGIEAPWFEPRGFVRILRRGAGLYRAVSAWVCSLQARAPGERSEVVQTILYAIANAPTLLSAAPFCSWLTLRKRDRNSSMVQSSIDSSNSPA